MQSSQAKAEPSRGRSALSNVLIRRNDVRIPATDTRKSQRLPRLTLFLHVDVISLPAGVRAPIYTLLIPCEVFDAFIEPIL